MTDAANVTASRHMRNATGRRKRRRGFSTIKDLGATGTASSARER